jgi:hypothetical protein
VLTFVYGTPADEALRSGHRSGISGKQQAKASVGDCADPRFVLAFGRQDAKVVCQGAPINRPDIRGGGFRRFELLEMFGMSYHAARKGPNLASPCREQDDDKNEENQRNSKSTACECICAEKLLPYSGDGSGEHVRLSHGCNIRRLSIRLDEGRS